jgi:hypothetical protein
MWFVAKAFFTSSAPLRLCEMSFAIKTFIYIKLGNTPPYVHVRRWLVLGQKE